MTAWDIIKFGNYCQDNGRKPEPIEWRVLSVEGDDAFLLADMNLDYRTYNDGKKKRVWRTCTLRKWLNEDFYNEAFDVDIRFLRGVCYKSN